MRPWPRHAGANKLRVDHTQCTRTHHEESHRPDLGNGLRGRRSACGRPVYLVREDWVCDKYGRKREDRKRPGGHSGQRDDLTSQGRPPFFPSAAQPASTHPLKELT